MTHCQCKMTEAVFRTVEVWLNDNLSLQSAEWLYAIVGELHFNEAISSLPWQMCVVNGHKAFPNQWTELKGISHPTSKHYQSLLMMAISLFNIRHIYKVVLLWQYLGIKAQRDVYRTSPTHSWYSLRQTHEVMKPGIFFKEYCKTSYVCRVLWIRWMMC